ncbi:MAG: response regulator, partial [Oligoflexales bacterium]|nr:response regulator [Oligoflexales bacterium]
RLKLQESAYANEVCLEPPNSSDFSRHKNLICKIVKTCIISLLFSSHSKLVVANDRADSSSMIFLKSGIEKYDIGKEVEYIEDKNGTIAVNDISSPKSENLWKKSLWNIPNFGYTDSVYWFRFKIKNENPISEEWLLELAFPIINEIDFYYYDQNNSLQSIKTGNIFPFESRRFNYINFVFPVLIPKNTEKTFFLRGGSNGSMQFPFILWTSKKFAESKNHEYAIQFFYAGILSVIILYNVFLAISLKNIVYFFYVLHVLTLLVLQMSLLGFSSQFFWPNIPILSTNGIAFMLGAAALSFYLFSVVFLELGKFEKKLYKAIMILPLFLIVDMGISFFIEYRPAVISAILIGSFHLLFILAVAVYHAYKGDKSARFFLLAFTLFILSAFLTASRHSNIFPINFITLYGFQISSLISVTLFSIFLGNKLKHNTIISKNRIDILYKKLEQLNANLEERVKEQTHELRTAYEMLKTMDRQKTTFFQNISHEIRTPLTLIMYPIENILKIMPDNRDAQIAMKNSKRLLRLINQLLDFQKLTSEGIKIKLTPINISVFLTACSQYFESLCKNKNIHLNIDFNKNEKIYVLAQTDALEKILFNYLSNAIKFSGEGRVIKITLNAEGSDVVLKVKDNGPGITKENQKKLFHIFSQIEDRKSENSQSTGIGLALVRELTEAMNGQVFVESLPNHGSTFGVRFPRFHPDLPVFDMLIIEDDIEFINDLCNELKGVGISFRTAMTIEEARKVSNENRFHCLLCDLYLQEDDMTQFLIEMARTLSGTNRLLLTGDCQIVDIDKIINEAKVKKIYIKPVNSADLIKDLKKLLKEESLTIGSETDLSEYRPKSGYITEDHKDERNLDDENSRQLSGEGRLILVVDDIKDVRDLITNTLKRKSYRFITARDGQEGLAMAKEYKPDLILVDWMMPKITGIEMIEKMATDDVLKAIPTILLTAKSDEESKIMGIKKGAHAYLSKPFDELELICTIENLIHLKDGEEKIRELNATLTEKVLKRFLPHKLVDDICNGTKTLEDEPRLMEITIMFADISGFAATSEILGPKVISKLLNLFFDRMTEIIFGYGGTVDKFIGDGIMAIFGAPEEMNGETQVREAVKCACSMQKALREFNKEWKEAYGKEFFMRVGIHKGTGIVGSFGGEKRSEYTVIGPVVNMAARIEKAATPGEIFFSNSIRDNLPEKGWSKVGVFDLKGIGETLIFKIDESCLDMEAIENPAKNTGAA